MKKKTEKTLVFDLDYAEFADPKKANAREMADRWRLYFEGFPKTRVLGSRLHSYMEAEVQKAIETGNANFFRLFAKQLESPKLPCPTSTWLLEIHCGKSGSPKFTEGELIKRAKEAGIFKGMDDECIRTTLKRKMGRLYLSFKNSPKNQ
jgi:hypothetical protein